MTNEYCHGLAINNSTTKVPTHRSITEYRTSWQITAHRLCYKYEQGTGRIEALPFRLRTKNHDVAFSLPAH